MAEKLNNIALVSAAGSGKTHALTKRFLLLFLHDQNFPLESLYAITFTNAAAFEMKSRIIRYLDVLAGAPVKNEPEQDVVDYFGSIFPDIRKRATSRKNHLLNNFSDVRISTFHSLFAAFLSCIPFAAGIMPDYEIIDEVDESLLFMQTLDEFLEAAHKDPSVLLSLSEMLEQQESTLKAGVDKLYKNLIPWMPYFNRLTQREEEVRKAVDARGAELIRGLEKFKNFVRDHEYAALTKSTGKINARLQKFLDKIDEFMTTQDIRGLESLVKYFLIDGIMTKKYMRDFASRLTAEVDFQKLVGDVVTHWYRYLESLSDREILVYLKPIFEIHERFRKEKQRASVLSFDDIEFFTREALTRSPETDYLYFKLGSEMNHLMIDEFQDTSFRQVEILEPIIDEITAVNPEDKSLFYVGDPNQAIFRWREGAPELFDYLIDKYRGKIASDRLSVNYRTKQEIIEFVNRILGRGDSAKPGNNGGWIRIEELGAFEKKDEGNEAVVQRVVTIAKELISDYGYAPDDIAVLTRTNRFARDLVYALSEVGIPFVGRARASILHEPDVRFVLQLLRFLDDPQDDFSLLHVLLSPVVNLNEETIRRLKAGKKTLYIALTDYHPDWSVTRKLAALLSRVYFSNPYEVIWRILQEFELKVSYSLATLLSAVLKYTNEGFNSLSSFIKWFEYHGLSIEVEETHARGMEIITVHRAKGLEFEIVIIPETNQDLRRPENEQLLFSYQPDSARPDKVYWRKYGKYLKGLVEAEQERLKKDSLNLLYVALTRAKSGIYMLGYTCPSTGAGFWLETIKERFGSEPYPRHEIPKRKMRKEEVEVRPYHITLVEEGPVVKEERALYSPTERGVEIIEPARRKGMEFGDMIHKALSRVTWLDEGNIDEEITRLVDYTKNTYARSSADEKHIEQRILPLLTETLLDPDLRFLFYRDMRDVVCKNELPIYFEDEKKDVSAHIDRLLIGPGEIVIMDYKTGNEKPEYKHQMRVYKKGIERIYPDRSIRTILVYLEKERGTKIMEV